MFEDSTNDNRVQLYAEQSRKTDIYLAMQLELVISRHDLGGTVAPQALETPQFVDCARDLRR